MSDNKYKISNVLAFLLFYNLKKNDMTVQFVSLVTREAIISLPAQVSVFLM